MPVPNSIRQKKFSQISLMKFLFSIFFTIQFLNALVPTRTALRYSLDGLVFFCIPAIFIVIAWLQYPKLLLLLKTEIHISPAQLLYAGFIGILLVFIYMLTFKNQHVMPSVLLYRFGSITIDGYAPGIFESYYTKLAVWILLAILPALAEESFYRTLLIQAFRHQPSQLRYVTLSAFLFAIVHFEQGILLLFMNAVLFSIPMSIYYYQTRKIGSLLVIHSVLNLGTSIGVFFL